jgi:hypothetical protein
MEYKNTIKAIYNLEYDKSNFNSGLINWYNNVIDKTINQLNVMDVSKMLRQNILWEVAINRAIELFIHDPFDGEMTDGDLLNLLLSIEKNYIKQNKHIEHLATLTNELSFTYMNFDWENESSKNLFKVNLDNLREIINKN